MFEKVAYTQQCDQFAFEEIEDLMDGVGPMDLIKPFMSIGGKKGNAFNPTSSGIF